MQMVVELAAAPSRTSAEAEEADSVLSLLPSVESAMPYREVSAIAAQPVNFLTTPAVQTQAVDLLFLTLVGEAADEAITRTVACALLFREESAIEALTADSLMATPVPPSQAVVVVAAVAVSLLASASPISPENVTVGRIVVSPMRWAMSQETGVVPLPRECAMPTSEESASAVLPADSAMMPRRARICLIAPLYCQAQSNRATVHLMVFDLRDKTFNLHSYSRNRCRGSRARISKFSGSLVKVF